MFFSIRMIVFIIMIIEFILYIKYRDYIEVPDVRNLSYRDACVLLANKGIKFADNNEYVYGNYIVADQGGTQGTLIDKDGDKLIKLNCILANESIIDEYSICNLSEESVSFEIGQKAIVELSVVTPKSKQGRTTPYILYSGYYDDEKKVWIQIGSKYIEAGEGIYKLQIDTEMLGLREGDYIFAFCIFDAENYSKGNSKAECDVQITLKGDYINYINDVFERNVISYEKRNDIFVINGVAYKYDVKELALNNVTNSDISKLTNCTNLKILKLSGEDITDLSPLEGLISLEVLEVRSAGLENIYSIANLNNLKTLLIGGMDYNGMVYSGKLSDISPIKQLTNLESLTISDCPVDNIKVLYNMTKMRNLWIYKTEVYDISVISNMVLLEDLRIHNNKIVDISSIYNLKNLKTLAISNNSIPKNQIDILWGKLSNCIIINN